MTVKMWKRSHADNFRLAKSQVLESPAAETYHCIQIPKFAVIMNAWCFVKEAGSSDTIQMGIEGNGASADPDFFLVVADLEATALGLKAAKFYVGAGDWHAYPGIYMNVAGGMVTLTVGTTQTSGEFIAMAAYTVIH